MAHPVDQRSQVCGCRTSVAVLLALLLTASVTLLLQKLQLDAKTWTPLIATMGEENHSAGSLSLLPYVLTPLPLRSVKPLGWLSDQLGLMADGLPGHEFDFYRIVRNNPWLGGHDEYSPLNEAFPYWFNGLVPLAYLTDDARLKEQALRSARYILSHQQSDGWLGPETDISKRNLWARYPVLLGLTQLAEAEAGTAVEGQILDSVYRFAHLMHSMLADNYTGYVWRPGYDFDDQWGRSRAADMILVLQWLYEREDAQADKRELRESMQYLADKAHNWTYWYSDGVYIEQDLDTLPTEVTDKVFPFVHGVNAGQGLKAGAVIRRFTADELYADSARRGVNWTFRYHGTPSGGIIGDERLSGLSPVRGVELCSVVETMYSLSYLYHVLGDVAFADQCEVTAYNALPVMLMPDWWAHQYVTQTNQPISHELQDSPFWNVGRFGQTYGLEPNYPCCVPNHIQGYPKFVSASFARFGVDGVAHALLGPGEVNTTTESGVSVHLTCETKYPFDLHLAYSVDCDGPFDLALRVPRWADSRDTTVSVNSQPAQPVQPHPTTGLHRLHFTSAGTHTVEYALATSVRVEPRANQTVSVYYGALLFAIPVGESIHSQKSTYPGAPEAAREYTIKPSTKWALAIDPSTLQLGTSSMSEESTLANPIWESGAPPVWMTVSACEIEWDLVGGYAPNPPPADQRKCISEPFRVKLVPYGSAKLHMAEMPTVALSSRSQLVVQQP